MTLVLFFASLVGWSLTVARVARCPIEGAPFVATAFLTMTLYVGALTGWLAFTAAALMIGGVAALALTVLDEVRGGRALRSAVRARPGFLLFVVAGLVVWARVRDARYRTWDEFAHWGLAAKELALTGRLPGLESSLTAREYPPGAALFQYFAGGVLGHTEGTAMLAQGVLVLAAMSVLFVGVGWRPRRVIAAAAVCAYVLPFMLGHGLDSVLIDHVLGAWFGALVAGYFLAGADGRAVGMVLPGSCTLVLFKTAGLFLALVAAVVILVDQVLQLVFAEARPRPARLAWSAAAVALLFVGPLLTDGLWKQRLHRLGIAPAFSTASMSSLHVPRTLAGGGDTERERRTAANFRAALTTAPVSAGPGALVLLKDRRRFLRNPLAYSPRASASGLAMSGWFVVLVTAAAAAAALQPLVRDRVRVGAATTTLALGGVAYLLGLLGVYQHVLGEYEGTRLASYERYAASYVLGAAVAVTALVVAGHRVGGRRGRVVVAAVAGACLLGAPLSSAAFLLRPVSGSTPARAAVEEVVAAARPALASSRKAYLVFQASDGFEAVIAAYALAPIRTNRSCWSLGRRYSDADVWTCGMTPAELARQLAGYDVLIMGRSDEAFWRAYGELFEDPETARRDRVFSIQTRPDGGVVLRARQD